MEYHQSNRERKINSRGKLREDKKHDARSKKHRDRALEQTKPKEKERVPVVDFGFMLHKSSGRANGSSSSSSSSESHHEPAHGVPEDLPMLMPTKTHNGPAMYHLSVKRVSCNNPYAHSVYVQYDGLVEVIEYHVKFYNGLHGTNYRANEVDIKYVQ